MTPEEAAAVEAAQERQLRDLATQIASMTKLGFDPLTIRKGTIAAVTDFADPPTVAINISGDTETTVSEVRVLNNYTPLVGQTVLIAKQGTEIFLLGSIASVNPRTLAASSEEANGWIKATLAAGSHGGGEGDVYYRRVMDHGSWKMQWRGQWNVSGTTMISSGGLDPNYRPAANRAVAAARNVNGADTCQVIFATTGAVTISSTSSATPSLNMASVSLTSDVSGSTSPTSLTDHADHSHGAGTLSAFNSGHSHSASSISISSPTWVSLNGVEYFL
jgi:hypothetical protein